MRIVKAKEVGEREVERLLTKAAFDEVELNPKIREGNKKLFGKDMSAAELVRMIVNDVRKDGDKAVMHYTKLIDKVDLTPENMLVSEEEFAAAEKAADPAVVESLRKAAANVRRYHEEQKPNSWMTYRDAGSILGQAIIPLDRVGIYVPGGTAAYPSSVIMNAVPASVAGVGEIIMMVPPKNHHDGAAEERQDQSLCARSGACGRRQENLQDRRRAGHRGDGVRHGDRAACR